MKLKLTPLTVAIWISLYGIARASLLASMVRLS